MSFPSFKRIINSSQEQLILKQIRKGVLFMPKRKKETPIAKTEDVEFSRDMADRDDFEALRRSKKADKRAENKK